MGFGYWGENKRHPRRNSWGIGFAPASKKQSGGTDETSFCPGSQGHGTDWRGRNSPAKKSFYKRDNSTSTWGERSKKEGVLDPQRSVRHFSLRTPLRDRRSMPQGRRGGGQRKVGKNKRGDTLVKQSSSGRNLCGCRGKKC